MPEFPPVLILAGGLGTRIRSICPDLPKALVPVNGEPFLSLQLNLLARQGVKDVVLCLGYMSQEIVDFVGDGSRFGLQVQYSYDGDRLLGTGGALLKASRLVGSTFALLYGDSYLDIDYAPVLQCFLTCQKPALMTVFRNANQFIPSNMKLSSDGMITGYNKEKPDPEMEHVDFGLTVLKREAFAGFCEDEPFDLSAVWQALISNRGLAGYEVAQRFYEVGSPEGLRDLEDYLRARVRAR